MLAYDSWRSHRMASMSATCRPAAGDALRSRLQSSADASRSWQFRCMASKVTFVHRPKAVFTDCSPADVPLGTASRQGRNAVEHRTKWCGSRARFRFWCWRIHVCSPKLEVGRERGELASTIVHGRPILNCVKQGRSQFATRVVDNDATRAHQSRTAHLGSRDHEPLAG